ncbi:MAG: hypothetical protein KME25_09920 [Symplocastrum torsivum CPER-KK1]|uniref:Uncharacterized protein n=1 Tax=Symplocastrum torsivum CPER-KK1 TaxID=450513 RepID=A0A951UAP3_9CYAN|nr:hypothetical protein [Symplocastrum torsivum CPER-KK1]
MRSHFRMLRDHPVLQKAIAPPLLLENRTFSFVVVRGTLQIYSSRSIH